jgi:putative membrane protein
VVERLARIDMIYGITAVAVLVTGMARIYLGVKGQAWYLTHPLLYVKLGLFVAVALLSIPPTLQILRWRRQLRADGTLPAPHEVRHTRRLVMIQAHVLPFIPLPAVFLARGFGA